MINALLILIVIYIFFRLITSIIIPKITNYRINKYKKDIREENIELYKRYENGYNQKVHPSIKKYYENKSKESEYETKQTKQQ
ncbi:MAG: hypothetical protein LBM25_00920 [Bacteroidales bacterium]|jgi:hypothetical protein|nr:hypothetical protein [Bacteroidales bacterium]